MCTYICMCVYLFIYVFMYVCVYVCTYEYMYICMYKCSMNVYIYILCVRVCMYVLFVYVCMYKFVRVHVSNMCVCKCVLCMYICCMYIHRNVCMRVHICVCMYVCMYLLCMYACVLLSICIYNRNKCRYACNVQFEKRACHLGENVTLRPRDQSQLSTPPCPRLYAQPIRAKHLPPPNPPLHCLNNHSKAPSTTKPSTFSARPIIAKHLTKSDQSHYSFPPLNQWSFGLATAKFYATKPMIMKLDLPNEYANSSIQMQIM